ncbi:hypothetical protein GCM10027020_37020 [Nocardioides salsibiostraticola]
MINSVPTLAGDGPNTSRLRRVLKGLGFDHTDPLTGLERAERLARRGPRMLAEATVDQQCALLILDLDHFKQINDAAGHLVGDEVLAAVGPRISACLMPDDLAVRLGGDEFAVLTAPANDNGWVEGLAQRLIEAISQPVIVEDLELNVSASVGVALSSRSSTLEQLSRAADQAMYAAKASGPGQWRLCADNHGEDERADRLIHDLAQDPGAAQITVHYQPQIDARDGRIVGFEALARWEHPELGTVLPHDFISLAERNGLIGPINHAIFGTALHDLPALHAVAPDARLSLNIASRHLMSRSLVQDLRDHLVASAVDPATVTLEITEAITRGSPEQWEVLDDLHRLGVAVAIRGFGANQTALSALWSSEAVSEVKMDPAFVRDAVTDAESARRFRAATGAAKGLGLRVVAQGVEERRAAVLGTDLGFDVLQGFWVAEAADLPSILAWATAWPEHRAERLSPHSPAELLSSPVSPTPPGLPAPREPAPLEPRPQTTATD